MKKLLKSIVLFIPLSILVYIILICFWGTLLPEFMSPNIGFLKGSYGHTYSRLKEVKDFKKVDVLFLGSSHTYRGFDTRLLKSEGLSSFNLGTSSQTPIQTNVLLKRYLEKLNPKVVIYEVYPKSFEIDGVESGLDIIANDKSDFANVEMALKLKNIKIMNSSVYYYFNEFNTPKFSEKETIGSDTYISGGFVEHTPANFRIIDHNSERIEINKKQLKQFEENIKMLYDKKIKVYLVQAPVTSKYYKAITNNKEIDSIFSRYEDYFNFNNLITLSDSLHFIDKDHLNQKGVLEFNSELLKRISLKKLEKL
ncbi:hypothetical protein [Psychroserpens luteus]|uniref:SGNH/GDSL hydrolase family protein n=1 Tax=Psychroserpens luteus TaxID=1434066 RepID=A0ABW5ZWN3_9FLAO|nr:hypothetical protein [Psychroserpens luteus]